MSKLDDVVSFDETIQTQQDEKQIIAQNIAFFRKKLGLSQTELAKRLQYSNKNISKWEQGETTPDIFTLKKLSSIFGVTLDTLTAPLSADNKNAVLAKKTVPLKWKIYMLLLVDAIIFLLGCVAYFVLASLSFTGFPLYYLYIYILPVIDLSIFIFICCVKRKVDVITLSLLGWLVVICFYVSFITANNIGYVFIIAVGYQVLAPILASLINSGKIIKLNKLILKHMKNKKG